MSLGGGVVPVQQCLLQLLLLHRLGQEFVHAGRQRPLRASVHHVGAQGDDRDMPLVIVAAAQHPGRFESVHLGHVDVHQIRSKSRRSTWASASWPLTAKLA